MAAQRRGSLLTTYDWPGNIRELKNIVERAIILSGNNPVIRRDNLSFHISQQDQEAPFTLAFDTKPKLSDIERQYLGMLLENYSGNRSKVAKTLGVSERSVYRMVEKYGFK